MRFLYVFRYFLNEAISNLWANRINNIVSIAIISFSLFTFGLFLLTAENLGRLIGRWTENIQINVFLKKDASRDASARLESIIKVAPCVARYDYISESEALRRFHSYYPAMKELTVDLDSNPFPSSYEITIRKEFQNKSAVQDFVNQLRAENSVDDVEYDQDWIDRVNFIIHAIRIVGLCFGGILMFTATFSISNVIKLMVLSRKDEIEIMRLVGATNTFIKGPFVTEGILQGLVGGALAIVILYGVYILIISRIASLESVFFSVTLVHFLSPTMILSTIGGGMIVGFFGSLISLAKFLKI